MLHIVVGSQYLQSCGMAAATDSSGRAEVDTSRAFRSVKEAVALFGERIIARETQVRLGAHANHCAVKERRSPWRDAVTIASSNEKLEGSHCVSLPDLVRRSHSNPNSIAFAAIAKHEGYYGSEPVTNLTPVSDTQQICVVPLSLPLPAPPPSISPYHGEGSLMIMSSIKKVEEEAAKTRQEAVQLKKRLAELELAMANLNAKLHRALSKLAHMEANNAAAARASIQQRDDDKTVALAVWTEPVARPRHALGHLLSLDDADEPEREAPRPQGIQRRETSTVERKAQKQKQKPIVPLVVPLINDMLFSLSKKKRMKDKESVYVKELYSLLSLT